jgi:sialate O-acetylesterase
MRWNVLWVLAGLAVVPASARADVRPDALCGDGMVLQQKSDVKIWGQADPGEDVTVTFSTDGKTAQKERAKADDKGRWVVTLRTGAAGGPYKMMIAGKNTIHYDNVLVGEVWVCSGQSNMEWTVGGCDKADKDYATSAPHNKNLRIFQVAKTPMARPKPQTTGKWVEADPKNVAGWTAVGYFFGRDLNEKLQVPVGLIQTAWGGTRAEAWTSPKALAASPTFKGEIENYRKATADADKENRGEKNANAPSALYNGMIRPILNYRIKGAIWYQGESNAGQAYRYRELFPLMIQDWRQKWKQGDFPFYFVQLAPFLAVKKEPSESAWAELREAQLMTLKLPNTGMAVITDYGNEYDIHPTPKRPVGERLALAALAKDYGQKIEYSGPTLAAMTVTGNKAVLTFNHAKGLNARELAPTLQRKNPKTGEVRAAWRVKDGSKDATLVGFTIAGEDHKFHPAMAKIEGNTVTVWSDAVSQPVAVRYGWADHPVCNLFNDAGLPASPFRTDDFPGVTAPKK